MMIFYEKYNAGINNHYWLDIWYRLAYISVYMNLFVDSIEYEMDLKSKSWHESCVCMSCAFLDFEFATY